MKTVIHYLSKYYGNNHYSEIVSWVNAQYARSGTVHGQPISLNDINDFEIVNTLKDAIEGLSLPFSTLVKGVSVIPRINSTGSDFEAILKLNHLAFLDHYTRAGLVIKDMMFAHEGDTVIYQGADQFIEYDIKDANQDNKMLCGFINFTVVDTDIEGSILIGSEEIEGEKSSGIANMFNGGEFLSQEEWLSSSMALLLKRLLSEPSSTVLIRELNPEELSYVRELIVLSESFYNGNKVEGTQDSDYYSDYGRLIGRTYRRFNALDKVKHKADTRVDNVTPISLAKTKKREEKNASGSVVPNSFKERSTPSGFSSF